MVNISTNVENKAVIGQWENCLILHKSVKVFQLNSAIAEANRQLGFYCLFDNQNTNDKDARQRPCNGIFEDLQLHFVDGTSIYDKGWVLKDQTLTLNDLGKMVLGTKYARKRVHEYQNKASLEARFKGNMPLVSAYQGWNWKNGVFNKDSVHGRILAKEFLVSKGIVDSMTIHQENHYGRNSSRTYTGTLSYLVGVFLRSGANYNPFGDSCSYTVKA